MGKSIWTITTPGDTVLLVNDSILGMPIKDEDGHPGIRGDMVQVRALTGKEKE